MKFFKIVLKAIGVIFALLVIYVVINLSTDRVMPWNKDEAITTALTWGGLATLPENASDIKVWSKGSIFTRQFVIEFKSDSAHVADWFKKSKNLQKHSLNESPGFKKIEIYPGEEGSMGGTVTVDKSENRVTIDMSWS